MRILLKKSFLKKYSQGEDQGISLTIHKSVVEIDLQRKQRGKILGLDETPIEKSWKILH